MRGRHISSIQNSKARKAANQIGERIKSGEIEIGSRLSGPAISDEYNLIGNQITQVFSFLKTDGLAELKKSQTGDSRGNRYFVKSPENPQGSSPERR